MQQLEDALSTPKEYLALVGAFALLLLFVLGVGVSSLTSLIGFVYPAYASLLSIESRQPSQTTQWLTYWTVYAFFSILEVLIDWLLYLVPFYFAFKLAFLLWLMAPQTLGALFLYDAFLKGFLKRNEARIDGAMEQAKRSASTVTKELAGASADLAGEGLKAAAKAAGKGD
mmetsp:Transcript_28773/g.57524  ORF Transcript_28773/g.57524 Transcript_28773/m.57524 type:complete len:171 (+) Transcript_28773:265-777(+)